MGSAENGDFCPIAPKMLQKEAILPKFVALIPDPRGVGP
jgi:hypothetical protein